MLAQFSFICSYGVDLTFSGFILRNKPQGNNGFIKIIFIWEHICKPSIDKICASRQVGIWVRFGSPVHWHIGFQLAHIAVLCLLVGQPDKITQHIYIKFWCPIFTNLLAIKLIILNVPVVYFSINSLKLIN